MKAANMTCHSVLTHYLRVGYYKVLQIEVHPLDSHHLPEHQTWFADRHLQEIVQLIKEIAIKRTNQTSKESIDTPGQLITGPTVKFGYGFKKKPENQRCLILHHNHSYKDWSSGEENEEDNTRQGRYRSYWVHWEKMMIFVLPVEQGNLQGVNRIFRALVPVMTGQVGISSYFTRSPRHTAPGPQNGESSRGVEPGDHLRGNLEVVDADSTSTRGNFDSQKALSDPNSPDDQQPQPKHEAETESGVITIEEDIITSDCKQNQEGLPEKTVPVKKDKNLVMKQTLKKYTCGNKLSKQYRRKPKLKPSNQKCVKPGQSADICSEILPSIRLQGSESESSVSYKGETSPGIERKRAVNSSPAAREDHSDNHSPVFSKRTVSQKRTVFSSILESGSESSDTDNPSLLSIPSRKAVAEPRNGYVVSGKNMSDSSSGSEDVVSCDRVSSDLFKKKKVKAHLKPKSRTLPGIEQYCVNKEGKRKLLGYSPKSGMARKALKLSSKGKGSSDFQRSKPQPAPLFPSQKPGASSLEKLSDHIHALPKNIAPTDNLGLTGEPTSVQSSSHTRRGRRGSKRISEFFEQCQQNTGIAELDFDADDELDVILLESQSIMPTVKDEEVNNLWRSIRCVEDVSALSEEALTFLVHHNESYLRDIFQGKMFCQRHQDYKAGGKKRKDMTYQMCFGAFSDDQADLVMDTLIAIFCRKHKKYLDYLMKVLLPETFVKIYMDVWEVSHERASTMIQDH